MEPTICHGPQKKKNFNSQSVTQLQFLIPFAEIIALFSFYFGVLWVNGLSFAPSSETRKWVYWWISGPYVCVIYAFNSILDCNPRFMGFHVHKSITGNLFFLQFCDIKHVAKRFYEGLANFPLTKLANWLVHIKCKNGPLYSHKSIINVFQIKQWDGQGVVHSR